jgi:hypothetical protein
MDPFLEAPPFWSDFSPSFLTEIRNRLIVDLLPKYDVRLEEYLLLEHDVEPTHRVKPDVVIRTQWDKEPFATGIAATMVRIDTSETVEAAYPDFDPLTQRRLVVTHRTSGRVVTIMELLSPINKASGKDGIDAYERKREELLTRSSHLIELDLLRGGERLPIKGNHPSGDYFVYIGRWERRPACQVIGWSWRAPLPSISVPLLPEDGEITLDLGAAFRDAYEPAYYDRRLPYHETLNPALSDEELQWIKSLNRDS